MKKVFVSLRKLFYRESILMLILGLVGGGLTSYWVTVKINNQNVILWDGLLLDPSQKPVADANIKIINRGDVLPTISTINGDFHFSIDCNIYPCHELVIEVNHPRYIRSIDTVELIDCNPCTRVLTLFQ
ncbi:MAG TPA: hypothetical protein DCP28_27860 [Cytophagales bacterium]|nr:hypothetical protein [Cytophagales bacterium]